MVVGIVLGTLSSTVRHSELVGKPLLIISVSNRPPVIAVDTQGAGVGDYVLVGEGPNKAGYGGIIKDVVLAILDNKV